MSLLQVHKRSSWYEREMMELVSSVSAVAKTLVPSTASVHCIT